MVDTMPISKNRVRSARATRRNHQWTDEDFVVLEQMTLEGKSAKEIAEVIGASEGSVLKYRQTKGFVQRPTHCYCGNLLTSAKTGRPPRYCSKRCTDLLDQAYV